MADIMNFDDFEQEIEDLLTDAVTVDQEELLTLLAFFEDDFENYDEIVSGVKAGELADEDFYDELFSELPAAAVKEDELLIPASADGYAPFELTGRLAGLTVADFDAEAKRFVFRGTEYVAASINF